MKKKLLIAIFVVNSGFLLAGDVKQEKLPLITAISDYGQSGVKVVKKGSIQRVYFSFFRSLFGYNKFYIQPFETEKCNEDIKEFDPKFNIPAILWSYCFKLNALDLEDKQKLSVKEHALLQFARKMADHENEWHEWHTCEFISDEAKKEKKTGSMRQHFETRLGENNQYTVRNDYNSPHYEHYTIIDNDSDNSTLNAVNLLENEAYHNELQFLQTQLHKMELYWSIRQKESDKAAEELAAEDYKTTHSLLEREIKSFKKPNNRQAFLKSFTKNKYVEKLQPMRDAYKAGNSESRS